MTEKSDTIMRLLLPEASYLDHPVRKNILYDNSLRLERIEKGRREMMSVGLAMTEKDKVLEAVLSDIERMEKERLIAGDVAQKIKTNIRLHFNREEERDNCKHILTNSSPRFMDYLRSHYPELTEGDIKMACYIQAGMTAKQIANMLLIQPSSVKMNRHRLRSRLHLSPEESLEGALTRIVCQLES